MAKKRKMRRAYMKVYSAGYVNTGKGPNAQVLAEYHQRASQKPEDAWLLTKFPGAQSLDTPEKVCAKAMQNVPRAIVLAKLTQGVYRGQHEQRLNFCNLLNGRFERVRLYFGGNTCFLVRSLSKGGNTRIWTSLMYTSSTQAKRDYGYGRVCWVEPPVEVPTEVADHNSG